MIHLYKNNNTNYKNNGDILLNISSIITKSLDGTYTAEITMPFNIKLNEITDGMVIKVEDNNISQLFRINNINLNGGIVKLSAVHIYTDLIDYFVDKALITNMTCLNSLKYCFNNIIFTNNIGDNKFIIDYDNSIDTHVLKSLEIKEDNILSIMKNTLIEAYRGEFDFDNFNITYKDKIGADNGYYIQDGKNLEDFSEDINCSDVITRIMPEGSNGLRLEELYVDSKYINKYNKIYFSHIKFSEVDFTPLPPEEQDKDYNKRKEEAQLKLKTLAENLFLLDNVDLPKISYLIKMEDLRYNKQYKNIAHLLNLNLGDIIRVNHSILNVNIKQRVVQTVYISGTVEQEGKYIELVLSNLEDTFSNSYSKESSSSTGNNGNNDGLTGRVEDLEKGFSEIEQKWDKVEFRFATSNINKIKNGAFIENLDFWSFNNIKTEGEETEVEDLFNYNRISKDEDFQTTALEIINNNLEENNKQAFALSDTFELKTGKDYTFSFKIKTGLNIKNTVISLIKRENNTDDNNFSEQIIGIFKENFKEEKFFIDFKNDDKSKYFRVKITHNGIIDSLSEIINNNVVITELFLAEGFGYKPFDYNDALYSGITQIDGNGVLVRHTNIKTMSRMSADGFKILDEAGNVLGSFGSSSEYSNVFADYVYATNIKTSVINKPEKWYVKDSIQENEENYLLNIQDYITDPFKCPKDRINSPLEIVDNRNGLIIENINIEDFSGSPIIIQLKDLNYSGQLIIRNCTSPIIIKGKKDEDKEMWITKLHGNIIIENCSNVIIDSMWVKCIKTHFSFVNITNFINIKNSTVLLKNLNIIGFTYFGVAENSTLTLDYITGDIIQYLELNNSRAYLSKKEWEEDMYVPNYSMNGSFVHGGIQFNCGNGQIVKKRVEETVENNTPLIRTYINKISFDYGELHAYTFNITKNEWIQYTSNNKLIQGYMEYLDGTKENYLSTVGISFVDEATAYIEDPKREVLNVKLKVRLKTKDFTNLKYKIGICTGINENTKEFKIIKDYGILSTVQLVRDNYIDIPVEIFNNLINKTASCIVFNITDKNNKECIFLDAYSIELIATIKYNN